MIRRGWIFVGWCHLCSSQCFYDLVCLRGVSQFSVVRLALGGSSQLILVWPRGLVPVYWCAGGPLGGSSLAKLSGGCPHGGHPIWNVIVGWP